MERFAAIRHPESLYIGGEWIHPHGGRTFDVRDSGSEEIFLTVAAAAKEDIDKAVAAARLAFDHGGWPRMRHAERAEYLRKIGSAFDKLAPASARAWTSESGVLHRVATERMHALGRIYDFYADLADTYPFVERRPSTLAEVGLIVREPVGVVAAIIPWNAPANLIAYKCAPALLTGCTIILKASPEAPAAAYLFAQACEEAGLPRGVVNVVTADREESELLVRHTGVDKIAFTGSTAAGRRIAAICGERIARCTMELGGKSPGIILDDASLEAAADAIASKSVFLTGQVCASLTRIIVTRRRHDSFVEALRDRLARVKVGDPFAPATDMGPLASAQHLGRVNQYIQIGKSEGAQLVLGGGRPPELESGYYVEPTLFADVSNDSRIGREEIFGPVLCVIAADDEADAVRIANDSIYGLNASVFTADPEKAYAVGRELRTGTVSHNSFRTDFGIAFGGFKQSGFGREGGTEGLSAYLETKTMLLDQMPASLLRV